MSVQYAQESLGTIRRRIGKLVYRRRFITDTILAVTANTVTLAKVAPLAPRQIAGANLFVYDGPAAGSIFNVSAHTQGTGVTTVLPSFIVPPLVGNHVEVWPEADIGPDDVNDAINLALLSVQGLVSVLTRAAPVLSTDRTSCTISGLNKIARLTYKMAGGERVTLRPRGTLDDPRGANTFWVANDTTLEWNVPVPTTATSVEVIGYRAPNLMSLDSDLAEVRSDFLVFKAASLLASSSVEGPALDPTANATRSSIWATEAQALRASLSVQHLANTQHLDRSV